MGAVVLMGGFQWVRSAEGISDASLLRWIRAGERRDALSRTNGKEEPMDAENARNETKSTHADKGTIETNGTPRVSSLALLQPEIHLDALPPSRALQTPLDLALGLLQTVELDVARHAVGVLAVGSVKRAKEVEFGGGGVALEGWGSGGGEKLQGWHAAGERQKRRKGEVGDGRESVLATNEERLKRARRTGKGESDATHPSPPRCPPSPRLPFPSPSRPCCSPQLHPLHPDRPRRS